MLIFTVLIFNVFCTIQSATLDRKNENFALENYGEVMAKNSNTLVIKAMPKDGNGDFMARGANDGDEVPGKIAVYLCYIFIVCFFL